MRITEYRIRLLIYSLCISILIASILTIVDFLKIYNIPFVNEVDKSSYIGGERIAHAGGCLFRYRQPDLTRRRLEQVFRHIHDHHSRERVIQFLKETLQRLESRGFGLGVKEVADTRVGDTITEDKRPTDKMLLGFKPAQPVVFCGLFPVDAADFEDLRSAMGKLRLNDASFYDLAGPTKSSRKGHAMNASWSKALIDDALFWVTYRPAITRKRLLSAGSRMALPRGIEPLFPG